MYRRQEVAMYTHQTYFRLPHKILKLWSQWWLKPMTKIYNFLKQYCEGQEMAYYKTIVVEYDTILSKIMDMHHNVYETGFKKPAYLVVGRDHFDDLFSQADIRYAMSFQITAKGFTHLYGMRIVLIPWITGCFCMPKMEDL